MVKYGAFSLAVLAIGEFNIKAMHHPPAMCFATSPNISGVKC
jgi:hypothetical protein